MKVKPAREICCRKHFYRCRCRVEGVNFSTEAFDDKKIEFNIFPDTQGIDNTILIETLNGKTPTAMLDSFYLQLDAQAKFRTDESS